MTTQTTFSWTSGPSDVPLPPLVVPSSAEHEEHQYVALYRTYGPIFRLSRSGKEPEIILAGPEANVFLARHEDEFFTTREQWEQFDAMISQNQGSMTQARDGEANGERRAVVTGHALAFWIRFPR